MWSKFSRHWPGGRWNTPPAGPQRPGMKEESQDEGRPAVSIGGHRRLGRSGQVCPDRQGRSRRADGRLRERSPLRRLMTRHQVAVRGAGQVCPALFAKTKVSVMDRLLLVSEVAERLRCSISNVYNLVAQGRLKCYRVGAG